MSWKASGERYAWYDVNDHRSWLCRRLIQAARLHGDSAEDSVFEVFESEWVRPDNEEIWPPELRREVLMEFGRMERFRQKAAEWLVRGEKEALSISNVVRRLEELKRTVQSWLALGESQRARETLSKLLRYSLGVHQKDYQVQSWIAWLERVNKAEPEKASQRLGFLAAALPDLREKEVLRHTSSDLLEVAWKWLPTSAVELFNWLLREGLIGFGDGLETLARQGMSEGRTANQITRMIFKEILLPAARQVSDDLLGELAQTAYTQEEGQAEEITTGLLRAVLGCALISQRPPLLKVLRKSAIERGLSWDSIVEKFEGALDIGTKFQVDPSHSPDDSTNALTSDDSHGYGVKGLNKLSQHRLGLGDRLGAWDVARQALLEPTRSRWIWWQDSEGFVETLSIMQEIDGPKAREAAFQSFVEELCHPDTSHFMLLGREFHRIAPLLASSVPDQPIWTSLQSYLEALFPCSRMVEPPLLDVVLSLGGAPPRALTRLIIGWLDHPVQEIAWGAQRIAVNLLLSINEDITDEFGAALNQFRGETPNFLGLLICLEAVSLKAPMLLNPFVDCLCNIARATNFFAREIASRILRRLSIPPPSSLRRELPDIYRLILPKRQDSLYPTEVLPQQFLPPTEIPSAVVVAFRGELDWIARIADVPAENLYTRVADLVRWPGEFDVYKEERSLRQNLELIRLDMSMRRPRTRRVRWAISVATAELLDAGRLSAEFVPQLEQLLRHADPFMLTILPDLRPAVIPSIAERLRKREVTEPPIPKNWTENADFSTCAVQPDIVDETLWVALAEETRLSWLDWDEAKEIRLGVLLPRDLPGSQFETHQDPLSEACIDVGALLVEHYEHIDADPGFPILLRSGFKLETPGQRCLAFNPTVGRILGWSLSREGLFRWENFSGNIMVESLWWQDGWMGRTPPASEDEVGEGWIVRASRQGWDKIREFYPQLFAHLLVRREAREQAPRQISACNLVSTSCGC